MSHAVFSPSSAHRWLACPGSIALCKGLPDESSEFADEGTFAHEIAARCLQSGAAAFELLGTEATINGRTYTADTDLTGYVQDYLDVVRPLAQAGELMVEQRLDISAITGEAGAHGTADAIVALGDELIVIDLKYGRGVEVMADENEQLQIYALAALQMLSVAGEFEHVRLIIVQPRRSHVSEWACSTEQLLEFGQAVRMKASWAQACLDQGLDEVEDLHPTEHGCRFCRAKATCPALQQRVVDTLADDFVDCSQPLALQLAGAEELIQNSDNARLAECLALCDLVEGWCKAVRARAEAELQAGNPVPGFKLVEGRRGPRKWSDLTEAETTLKVMGLKHALMYDYDVISPTTAEKLVKAGEIGPKQWIKLQALITQPEGKPTVAPASDKRPALAARATADDFDVVTS